jgi:hypothetical protein
MRRTCLIATALAILISAAISPASAGQHPQDHDGWTLGFGFGGGSAALNLDNGDSSDREGGGMGNFRVGYPLNEKFSLQFESNAWTKTENDVTVTFSASTFGLAWFPKEGLVLRGGVGFGGTTVSVSSGNTTTTQSENGVGLHGAVGYDFRLTRTFALGPQFDLGYSSFDGGSSNWYGLGLNLNWYFIKKA